MKGSLGQLSLGFGKTVFQFEEVLPPAPDDILSVKIVDPKNSDVLMYDDSVQKWTNRASTILTDGGNF